MVKIISHMLILVVTAATHFSLASAAVSCNVGADGVAICVDGTSTITGPTVGTTAGPVACNVGFDGITCTPANGPTTIAGAPAGGAGVASASVSCSAGTDGITCGSGPTVTPPGTSPIPTASVSCSVGSDGIACGGAQPSHSASAGKGTTASALTFVSVGLAVAAYQLF
ncbi:hypothetical protein B0H19DRAFT_1083292 [Mycena capillaripes]|nr:hypothetical protein B0H19DRAFT_1083292 [Mycena capillaripes]